MNKTLIQAALAMGLLLASGEAPAAKAISTINSGGQASTAVPITRAMVVDAVNAVCKAWNTVGIADVMDPEFQDREAFLSSFAAVPRDARLVLVTVGDPVITGDRVRVDLTVAVEFTRNGTLQRDVPRLVTWTFKRHD